MWERGKMAGAMVQMSCLYRGLLMVRATGIRTLIPGLAPSQFRVFSIKKEPELEENPYYSKYEEKIKKLRSSKPEEYSTRLERRGDLKAQPIGRSKQAEFVQFVETQKDKKEEGFGNFTREKTLGKILNLDMIREKSGSEIGELWMRYFSTKDTVSAVIPGSTFDIIFDRAKSCPTFLYALPQNEGYEFFVGQWSGHELHFTSLINVQTMGENAPSRLVLYHYPDLREEKDIVLMTAEMESKFVTVQQAQCLANQVQLFYGTQRHETFRLVDMFNHKPEEFKHMAVIAELEQSGIGTSFTTN